MPLLRTEHPSKFRITERNDGFVSLQSINATTGLVRRNIFNFEYLESVKEMHNTLGQFLARQAHAQAHTE